MIYGEMLMKPTVQELSPRERALVEAAIKATKADPYHTERHGGFSLEVHPELVGYYLSRSFNKAIPVYKTDNGLFAVENDPSSNHVTEWAVQPHDVYSVTE